MVPRDDKGRFPKGISGNPAGRKKRQVEDDFMRLLAGAVSTKDWREICDKAIAQAKAGDAVARKWLGDYLIGAPVQRMEHSGMEGGPIQYVEVVLDSTGGE
jgi:hypothetical protein